MKNMQKIMIKTPIPEIQKILKYKFMEQKSNKVLPLQNYKLLDKTKLGNCVDFAYAVSDLLYHNYNCNPEILDVAIGKDNASYGHDMCIFKYDNDYYVINILPDNLSKIFQGKNKDDVIKTAVKYQIQLIRTYIMPDAKYASYYLWKFNPEIKFKNQKEYKIFTRKNSYRKITWIL